MDLSRKTVLCVVSINTLNKIKGDMQTWYIFDPMPYVVSPLTICSRNKGGISVKALVVAGFCALHPFNFTTPSVFLNKRRLILFKQWSTTV
jgi:hypothetical protein